jgi:RNA polymerase sigma-70 factor (ECF subfamily)
LQDQAAWERLVALYTPLVYRWCRCSGLQAADAANVGQEVFLAVARKIGDFRRDRPQDSFRAWLRTITRNKIADHFRRVWSQLAAGGGDELATVPDPRAEDQLDGPQASEEVSLLFRRAVELIEAEFEEPTWRAFWRVVIDGVSPGEAAAELGLSLNAVYLAKSRVLRRLREEFADLEDL